MNIRGLPEVNTISDSGKISSMHGISNLPSNREYFGLNEERRSENFGRGGGRGGHHGGKIYHHRGGGGRHHGLRPGMRGLAGYGLNYNPYNTAYVQPVYVQQATPACGGSNCNTFLNSDTNKYEASPGTQCTCCDFGKICRMNSPNNVKYNDCCPGLDCKNGYCMN